MEDLYLEYDEGIILEASEVERYGVREDCLDELILTNKHLILVYEYKEGVFSKAEKRVEKIPFCDIKVVGGKAQAMRVDDDDYGVVMRLLYKNGNRDYFAFSNEKRDIPQWINAINKAVTGSDVPVIEEKKKEKRGGLFAFGKKDECKKPVVKEQTRIEQSVVRKTPQDSGAEYMFCSNCGEKINRNSKFCSVCGSKVGEVPQQIIENQSNQRQQEFVGKVYKCPNCGCVISVSTAVCPDCGMKLTKTEDKQTLREFQHKMIEIESKQKGVGILNVYKDIFVGANNQAVALIRNCPIPDTVDEIVELMIYASTKIEGSRNGDEESAWHSLMKQTYMKARMSFPTTPEFREIEKIYLQKKEEYEW